MIRASLFILLTSLSLTLNLSPASAAVTTLTGGTATVSIPVGEKTPAFTFLNNTGVPICDLVISHSGAAGADISGCVVDDPQHTDEDWDVDDDENGSLSTTGTGAESSAAPGAAGEGAGGAALDHADNNQPTADGKVRLQENGADADSEAKCVGNNRNFQVTCKLSAAGTPGETLTIQPTNVRDANLCAFADGLLGRDEHCAIAANRTITTAFAAFGRDSGLVNSVTVTATGDDGTALLVALESTPRGFIDIGSGTITFVPPLDASRGLLIYGKLSENGDVVISVKGERATPVPVEPVDRN
ncbi:MAG TPA: hypothetical protein VN851_17730 [Thermoanaerobaculia bacterium]|nr:hypothetical protein [Thermoanaerobaculia bacterium]